MYQQILKMCNQIINFIKYSNFPNYIENQFIHSYIILIGAFILGNKKYYPIITFFSMIFLYLYSYFIHKLFHNLPKPFNVHMDYHHNSNNEKSIISKYINLIIELISNILFFAIIYFIQALININIIPNIFIFYYGFIYVSTHIINYSLFHLSPEHVIHHKTSDISSDEDVKTCNYGPDLLDHVFETNFSNTFENYNHIIPNIFISFLLAKYLFC